MKNEAKSFTLGAEECDWIRDALLIGLASYGSLVQGLNSIEVFESIHGKRPEWLDLRHPTGTSDVVSRFATAMTVLDSAVRP